MTSSTSSGPSSAAFTAFMCASRERRRVLLVASVPRLAAFAFARLRFAGREVLFLLFLATMMIPGTVTRTARAS